jgi:hypothetical protein
MKDAADITFSISRLPQFGQEMVTSSPIFTKNSATLLQALHLYSYIGISKYLLVKDHETLKYYEQSALL